MEDTVGRMVFIAGKNLKMDFERITQFRSLTKTAVLKQFVKRFVEDTDSAIDYLFK